MRMPWVSPEAERAQCQRMQHGRAPARRHKALALDVRTLADRARRAQAGLWDPPVRHRKDTHQSSCQEPAARRQAPCSGTFNRGHAASAPDTREAGAEAGHAPPVRARFRALGLQQRAAASPRRVSACPAVAVSITRLAEHGRVRTWLSGRAARRPPGPPSRLSSALLLNCVTLRTASAHRSTNGEGVQRAWSPPWLPPKSSHSRKHARPTASATMT